MSVKCERSSETVMIALSILTSKPCRAFTIPHGSSLLDHLLYPPTGLLDLLLLTTISLPLIPRLYLSWSLLLSLCSSLLLRSSLLHTQPVIYSTDLLAYTYRAAHLSLAAYLASSVPFTPLVSPSAPFHTPLGIHNHFIVLWATRLYLASRWWADIYILRSMYLTSYTQTIPAYRILEHNFAFVAPSSLQPCQ